MKINVMSKNIVNIMESLSNNGSIVRLLLIDKPNPYEAEMPAGFTNNTQIVNQNSEFCRISPTPFNPNAEEEDKTFIRVYYNQGEFDSELVSESSLHIDIIVAKSLWLIKGIDGKESIRPYDIIDNVMDTIGRRAGNPLISVNFTGYQHLAVNTKFDAIRLYADYFKPEV